MEGAITDYTQAISVNPQFSLAYNNRGLAKQNKGDLDGAIADYTQAISIDPQDFTVYSRRGFIKKESDFEGALSDFTQAIALGTKEAQIYFARGILYSQKREQEKTKQDFIQFLQLSKNTIDPEEKRMREFVFKLFPDLKK